MGFFYVDETIQDRGGFILASIVYCGKDLTLQVFQALQEVGLRPSEDEYKSSSKMSANPQQQELRYKLKGLVGEVRVGVVIIPRDKRDDLGDECLKGLAKIIAANGLSDENHTIFFDREILHTNAAVEEFRRMTFGRCEIQTGKDSKTIGGIQVADSVAHSLGIMLLEQMGIVKKKIIYEEFRGDGRAEIEIGFELWHGLRFSFFRNNYAIGATEDDPVGTMMYDVENFGLYIAPQCGEDITTAALKRFGECYLGCTA